MTSVAIFLYAHTPLIHVQIPLLQLKALNYHLLKHLLIALSVQSTMIHSAQLKNHDPLPRRGTGVLISKASRLALETPNPLFSG
jgi:hypothetical protein